VETDESRNVKKDGAGKFKSEGTGPGVYITLLIHASTSSGLPGPRPREGDAARLRFGADLVPAIPDTDLSSCLSPLSTVHPPVQDPGSRMSFNDDDDDRNGN
jgi:hypothetical protein